MCIFYGLWKFTWVYFCLCRRRTCWRRCTRTTARKSETSRRSSTSSAGTWPGAPFSALNTLLWLKPLFLITSCSCANVRWDSFLIPHLTVFFYKLDFCSFLLQFNFGGIRRDRIHRGKSRSIRCPPYWTHFRFLDKIWRLFRNGFPSTYRVLMVGIVGI